MRKPTRKEIDEFINYRANHAALVQKIGQVVFDENYSDHDKDKIGAVGRELELFTMRMASKSSNLKLTEEDKNTLRKVSARHALTSKHHAEYWDPSITMRNFDEKDEGIVHMSKMPRRHIREMLADWAACALYHNEPIFNWYNNQINKYLIATGGQKDYMKKCLSEIQRAVEKYNITFPGREYNVDQVEPLNEKILKKGDKWVVTDHTGERNLGTYNTKAEAEKRLQQVEYFKHINERGFFYNVKASNKIDESGIHTDNLSMIKLDHLPEGSQAFFVFPPGDSLIDDVCYHDIPACCVIELDEEVSAAAFAGMVPEHMTSVVQPVEGEDLIKMSGLKESKCFRDFVMDHLTDIHDAPEFTYQDYLDYIQGNF